MLSWVSVTPWLNSLPPCFSPSFATLNTVVVSQPSITVSGTLERSSFLGSHSALTIYTMSGLGEFLPSFRPSLQSSRSSSSTGCLSRHVSSWPRTGTRRLLPSLLSTTPMAMSTTPPSSSSTARSRKPSGWRSRARRIAATATSSVLRETVTDLPFYCHLVSSPSGLEMPSFPITPASYTTQLVSQTRPRNSVYRLVRLLWLSSSPSPWLCSSTKLDVVHSSWRLREACLERSSSGL